MVKLPGGAVTALGITQLVGWGTTFYIPAVLGHKMAVDAGWGTSEVFGAFSCSLLVAGAVSKRIGRAIDLRGARAVMSTGSVGVVLGLLMLASASHWIQLFLAWTLLGVASRATQYDAAFAAIAALTGAGARRAISMITLWGGLASSVFWPLGHLLDETLGWRWTVVIYALVNLVICLPLHLRFASARRACAVAAGPGSDRPGTGPTAVPPAAAPNPAPTPAAAPASGAPTAAQGTLHGPERERALLVFAVVLSAFSFVFSCIAAHMITLLQGLGLAGATAVALSSIMGIAQVGARFLEMTAQRWFAPMSIGVIALALLPVSLTVMLAAGAAPTVIAAACVIYGAAIGLVTVVRGAVPLVLFGHAGYATTLGRIAAPGLATAALAPLLFDWILGTLGAHGALVLLLAIALTSLAGMLWLARQQVGASSS
jgi:MFS family permease